MVLAGVVHTARRGPKREGRSVWTSVKSWQGIKSVTSLAKKSGKLEEKYVAKKYGVRRGEEARKRLGAGGRAPTKTEREYTTLKPFFKNLLNLNINRDGAEMRLLQERGSRCRLCNRVRQEDGRSPLSVLGIKWTENRQADNRRI